MNFFLQDNEAQYLQIKKLVNNNNESLPWLILSLSL